MSAFIKQLTDNDERNVYPVSKAEAIIMSDGKTAEEAILEVKKTADAALPKTANAVSASTAAKLTTPHSFTLSGGATGTATGFDGTDDVTINVTAINPDNLSKAVPTSKGGTGTTTGQAPSATKLATVHTINVTDKASPANTGTAAKFDGTGDAVVTLPETIKATIKGNADTASKLNHTLKFSGAATGSFDGSTDQTINIPILPVDATETTGGLLSAEDKKKLDGIEDGAQVNVVTSVASKTGSVVLGKADVGLGNVDNTADSTKNVNSALTLKNARNFHIEDSASTPNKGTAAAFNGGADITLKLPTVITATLKGNADTATSATSATSAAKLTTARKLGVALNSTTAQTFDGSKDVTNLPISGTLGIANGGTGTTNGQAPLATKLATARKINNVAFDGTKDITIADATKLPLAGGTMTGSITSSVTTGTYLKGNQGTAIINSTAGAGSYTTLAKMNSTNGYFTISEYGAAMYVYYTAKTTVDSASNTTTKALKLLDENGNTQFPGTVTATAFTGKASTAGTADKVAHAITFSGAVTGTYDGSKALAINIPTSSGPTFSLEGTTLTITP